MDDRRSPLGVVTMDKRHTYTEEQIEFILDNYKTMSDKNIGKVLGRSGDAITKKLKQLKLKKDNRNIRNNYLEAVEKRELGKPKKYKIGKKDWRKFVTISKGRRILESHFVWCMQPGNLPYVPKGFVIHHYNGDSKDNSPSNLLLISKTDHNKAHNIISKSIREEML
jgi:hypothetical protein